LLYENICTTQIVLLRSTLEFLSIDFINQ